MRKYSMVCLGAVLSLVAVGCELQTPSAKSVNIQRSLIRGVGDNAVTVSLDAIKDDAQVVDVQKKTRDICIAVQAFIQSGKVADLTIPEITDALKKLVPAEYQFLVDILIAQVQGITVNTQKIGANNVERINSACVGIIRGCDLYDVKYRPVTAVAVPAVSADKAVVNKVVKVKDFGVSMKKEMKVR